MTRNLSRAIGDELLKADNFKYYLFSVEVKLISSNERFINTIIDSKTRNHDIVLRRAYRDEYWTAPVSVIWFIDNRTERKELVIKNETQLYCNNILKKHLSNGYFFYNNKRVQIENISNEIMIYLSKELKMYAFMVSIDIRSLDYSSSSHCYRNSDFYFSSQFNGNGFYALLSVSGFLIE